jgi:ribosomal protein L37AE/L43A
MSRAWNSDAQLEGEPEISHTCGECDGALYIADGLWQCRDCDWSYPAGIGNSDAGPGARGDW